VTQTRTAGRGVKKRRNKESWTAFQWNRGTHIETREGWDLEKTVGVLKVCTTLKNDSGKKQDNKITTAIANKNNKGKHRSAKNSSQENLLRNYPSVEGTN